MSQTWGRPERIQWVWDLSCGPQQWKQSLHLVMPLFHDHNCTCQHNSDEAYRKCESQMTPFQVRPHGTPCTETDPHVSATEHYKLCRTRDSVVSYPQVWAGITPKPLCPRLFASATIFCLWIYHWLFHRFIYSGGTFLVCINYRLVWVLRAVSIGIFWFGFSALFSSVSFWSGFSTLFSTESFFAPFWYGLTEDGGLELFFEFCSSRSIWSTANSCRYTQPLPEYPVQEIGNSYDSSAQYLLFLTILRVVWYAISKFLSRFFPIQMKKKEGGSEQLPFFNASAIVSSFSPGFSQFTNL